MNPWAGLPFNKIMLPGEYFEDVLCEWKWFGMLWNLDALVSLALRAPALLANMHAMYVKATFPLQYAGRH